MSSSKQQLEDEAAKKKGRASSSSNPPLTAQVSSASASDEKQQMTTEETVDSSSRSFVRLSARRKHYLEAKQSSKDSSYSLDEAAAEGENKPGSDARERNRDLKLRQQVRRSDYLKKKEQERKRNSERAIVANQAEEEKKNQVDDVDLEAGKVRKTLGEKDSNEEDIHRLEVSAVSTIRKGVLRKSDIGPSTDPTMPRAMPGAYRYTSEGHCWVDDSDDDLHDQSDDLLPSPSPSPSPRPPPPPTEEPFVMTNVVATLVNEDDENKPIVTAESVQAEGFFHNKTRALALLVVLLVLVVGLAVGLGLSLSGSGGGDSTQTTVPEMDKSFVLAIDPIDGERSSRFGSSVSMCNDGSRFAVASPGNGRVQVFKTDGQGGHIQLGQNFTFDPSVIGSSRHVRTGIVVDLSADCQVLAVGLPYHENKETGEQTGRVELYQYDAELDSWEALGVPHSIPGDTAGDFAGSFISLSRDGGLVAIGSPGHAENGEFSGQVRVFQLTQREGSWAQLGSPMYGKVPGESFGFSVSLSSGYGSNVVAVGATTPTGANSAAATVFRFRTGEWVQQGSAIRPDPQFQIGIETAWLVRLSTDGAKFVISNLFLGQDEDEGVAVVSDNKALYVAAYEFNTEQDDWMQLGRNLHTNKEGAKSGYTVALSEDGTRIAMGDPGVGDAGGLSGHAHIYEYSEGRWCQLGENIEGYAAGDLAGFSVSLSGDGNRILVGSPLNRALGSERGRIWVKDVVEDAVTTWCEAQ